MAKELWKGNEAIAEAAICAGLEAYFGYPITPQTELLEYMAARMPELGRLFLQAESELAAINMVYGAACGGSRAMTSSSSPGISLMQEGLSYISGSEVPCVVVDVMRGGPGLGNIQPSQADYAQMVHSSGHGDYHNVVLAPASVQEATDFTYNAFDLVEKYRTIVVILADGTIGQMMEPAVMPPMKNLPTTKPDWALTGAKNRPHRSITSLNLTADGLEKHNLHLQEKLKLIRAQETRSQEFMTKDADYLMVAFGTAGRVATSAVRQLRANGVRVGLFRPITLWPFPDTRLQTLAARKKAVLVVEMNAGQMLLDVKATVEGRAPVHFYGRMGGVIPLPDEIINAINTLVPIYDSVRTASRAPRRHSTNNHGDTRVASWQALPAVAEEKS